MTFDKEKFHRSLIEAYKGEETPDAKFKLGEKVYKGCIVNTILASRDAGEGIEYLLDSYPYLVWEHELSRTLPD